MTPDQFRKIALSFEGAVESAHMGHPDFRLGGKIFASLGAGGPDVGMVKLTPQQQQVLCQAEEEVYRPCNGAWGKQGCTYVQLPAAKVVSVRGALKLAAENMLSSLAAKKQTKKAASKSRGSQAPLPARRTSPKKIKPPGPTANSD